MMKHQCIGFPMFEEMSSKETWMSCFLPFKRQQSPELPLTPAKAISAEDLLQKSVVLEGTQLAHAEAWRWRFDVPSVSSFQTRMFSYLGIYQKKPVLSITSSWEIGFWEHDIEAPKMQGRARGHKGERKTYHINPYHHITMEFGWIWRIFIECGKKTHARKTAQGRSARGPILPKSNRNFRQPPFAVMMRVHLMHQCLW